MEPERRLDHDADGVTRPIGLLATQVSGRPGHARCACGVTPTCGLWVAYSLSRRELVVAGTVWGSRRQAWVALQATQ